MNSFTKFFVTIALLCTISFAANAQRADRPSHNPEERAEKQTTRMVDHLSLNESQAAQVAEINLRYANKMHEAHEGDKENREAMKEIRTAIDTEKIAELKQILTEEQFASFEEIHANRKRKGDRKGPRNGDRNEDRGGSAK